MKRVMVFLWIAVVMFVAVHSANAGILNTVDANDFVQIINASEPSVAWGTDLSSGKGIETATVSLITYTNRDYALGSLRIGYSGQKLDNPSAAIGAIELVTPNLVRRFLPEDLKDWKANFKILTLAPSVSVFGGYNVNDKDLDEKWAYGFTAGPKFTF